MIGTLGYTVCFIWFCIMYFMLIKITEKQLQKDGEIVARESTNLIKFFKKAGWYP